jgi:hypothetical protein
MFSRSPSGFAEYDCEGEKKTIQPESLFSPSHFYALKKSAACFR